MDTMLKLTLGLLLVLFIASVSVFSYQAYVDRAYRESLSGTYSYTCTITTDSPLRNVTFFIPVPADLTGNSPVVERFGYGTVSGVPADWDLKLYDTGKATMVRISRKVGKLNIYCPPYMKIHILLRRPYIYNKEPLFSASQHISKVLRINMVICFFYCFKKLRHSSIS